ncbi:hypothetical protein E3N88_01117 [Mikania micrantha]|uniref:Uncharacterized protein n=1 Tax=Mikania micrantha TaxID=192012 RepID=A0A5N6Q200_9ASTR|nr:hypothetical protein E3N88_01117 [Mikania micrantha]
MGQSNDHSYISPALMSLRHFIKQLVGGRFEEDSNKPEWILQKVVASVHRSKRTRRLQTVISEAVVVSCERTTANVKSTLCVEGCGRNGWRQQLLWWCSQKKSTMGAPSEVTVDGGG